MKSARALVAMVAVFILASVSLAAYRSVSFEMTPVLTSPIGSSVGGMYTSSADTKPHFITSAGIDYAAGDAWHLHTTAGAPGALVFGDCWTDSTDSYRVWCKESTGNIRQRTDVGASGSIGIPASPSVFRAHADTAALTGYLGGADRGAAASSQVVLFTSHSAQALRYLACTTGAPPGGVVSDVITVQKSTDQGTTWTDTGSACTVAGSSKTCLSAFVVSVAQYDELAVKIVRNALSGSMVYNCTGVVN